MWKEICEESIGLDDKIFRRGIFRVCVRGVVSVEDVRKVREVIKFEVFR